MGAEHHVAMGVSSLRPVALPASSAPSKTCLACENSSRWINVSARIARCSTSSTCRPTTSLSSPGIALRAGFQQMRHSPRQKTSNLGINLSRKMLRLEGGVEGSGATTRTLSCLVGSELEASSMATFSAFLKRPWKKRGTLFIAAVR